MLIAGQKTSFKIARGIDKLSANNWLTTADIFIDPTHKDYHLKKKTTVKNCDSMICESPWEKAELAHLFRYQYKLEQAHLSTKSWCCSVSGFKSPRGS